MEDITTDGINCELPLNESAPINSTSIDKILAELTEVAKSSSKFLFSLFMKSIGSTTLVAGTLLFCLSALGLNELNQIEPLNNSEEYIPLFNSVILTGVLGTVSSAVGVVCLRASKDVLSITSEEVTSQ